MFDLRQLPSLAVMAPAFARCAAVVPSLCPGLRCMTVISSVCPALRLIPNPLPTDMLSAAPAEKNITIH